MKISASILSGDFAYLGDAVKKAESGGADYIHIDVMDGHFVPNITIGPQMVSALKKYTKLPLDVHLMITDPDKYIERFVNSGADLLTIHSEASLHLHRSIQLIKSFGIKCGISLNPATPLDVLDYLLPDLDMILIMTVNPGFGGQKFIPQMFDKIGKVKSMIEEHSSGIILEVDGGVCKDNIGMLHKLGVDICVAGSAVFDTDSVEKAICDLKNHCC